MLDNDSTAHCDLKDIMVFPGADEKIAIVYIIDQAKGNCQWVFITISSGDETSFQNLKRNEELILAGNVQPAF